MAVVKQEAVEVEAPRERDEGPRVKTEPSAEAAAKAKPGKVDLTRATRSEAARARGAPTSWGLGGKQVQR